MEAPQALVSVAERFTTAVTASGGLNGINCMVGQQQRLVMRGAISVARAVVMRLLWFMIVWVWA